MKIAESFAREVNVKQACAALTVPRSGFYRWKRRDEKRTNESSRPVSPLALSDDERQFVLDVLHSDRFVDRAPQEVYAALLDEGNYLCSVRTMYRVLDNHDEVKERRKQLRHPSYVKPELIAEVPNQV